METTGVLTAVVDPKAWLDAAPVTVALLGAALLLDVNAVSKMFFAKNLYLWWNWLVSAVFLVSFLSILSMRYESVDELWNQQSTLIILVSSFAYLLAFYFIQAVHDCLQPPPSGSNTTDSNTSGADTRHRQPSACSLVSLVFGVLFACGAVAFRILVPNSSSSSSSSNSNSAGTTAYTLVSGLVANSTPSSPPLLLACAWACAVVIAVVLFARSSTSSAAEDALKTKKGREFRKMRAKSYPGTYPNGWYALAQSSDVPIGKVIEAQACGKVFAVFRGEDGKVGILDAYCIHLGANMTVGGKVVGNCLECPFHRWRFDTEGKCTHIPYADKIPEVAKTPAWSVREYYGNICVYYDADGLRDPPYELDPYPQIDSGQFVYRGTYSEWVDMHLQEFAENAVDYMHFEPLHGKMCLPWTNIIIPGITIKHVARWEMDDTPGREHVSYFHDHAWLVVLGRELKRTGATAKTTMMGPASIVSFYFNIPDMGEIVLFQTHTPVEPCRLKVTFSWYADKKIPRILVWYVVGNWVAQWRNDISVWENKVYVSKPVLVKGDGPVPRLRRWYMQFYSPTNQNNSDDAQADRCGGAPDW